MKPSYYCAERGEGNNCKQHRRQSAVNFLIYKIGFGQQQQIKTAQKDAFGPCYNTHNPYIMGGNGLLTGIVKQNKERVN